MPEQAAHQPLVPDGTQGESEGTTPPQPGPKRANRVLLIGSLAILFLAVAIIVTLRLTRRDASEEHTQPPDQVTAGDELTGPASQEIAWTFQDPSGFFSAPLVSADGTLYIASRAGILHALDPAGNSLWEATLPAAPAGGALAADGTLYITSGDGTLYALGPAGKALWEAGLPATPVGSPALSAAGDVYVSDKDGNLSAFAPDGSPRWRLEPPERKASPVGPLVAPDGTIYHVVGNTVEAVSSEGQPLWQTQTRTFRIYRSLQLDASGTLLFYADNVLDARDGTLLELATPLDVDQYILGNDGQTYLRSAHTVMQLRPAASGIEIVQSVQWDHRGIYKSVVSSDVPPSYAGVTRQGVIWLLYNVIYGELAIAWVDMSGHILGTVHDQLAGDVVAVLDQDATIYVCGLKNPRASSPTPQCKAFLPGSEEPVWQVELESGQELAGAILVPQRLYVATAGGTLYAIGEGQSGTQVERPARPATPTPQRGAERGEGVVGSGAATPTPGAEFQAQAPTATPPISLPATPVTVGDLLTYTLTVVNNGPSLARDVTVTDTLPAGVAFVAATSSQGAGCNVGQVANLPKALTCHLGDLADGASAQVTVVARVDVWTVETITSTAAVTSRTADPDPLDNTMDGPFVVSPGADLALRQFDTPDPVAAGTPLTYTLVVTNNGPSRARDVILTDTLPAGVTFVAATSSQGAGCTVGQVGNLPSTLLCHLGDLHSSDGASITLLVAVAPSTRGTITNTVTISASQPDPNPTNNTADEATTVTAEADLTITDS